MIHTEQEVEADQSVQPPSSGGPTVHILHIFGQLFSMKRGFVWHCLIDSQYEHIGFLSEQSPPEAGTLTICIVWTNGEVEVIGFMYDIRRSGLPENV